MVVSVTLPYPPSTNHLYRRLRGQLALTPEAREFRHHARLICASVVDRPISDPVAVYLRIYRPRRVGDLDNLLKAVLDACNGVIWVDDALVTGIHAQRFEDATNPRVELTAIPAPTISATYDALYDHLHQLQALTDATTSPSDAVG
jgi:crossover junction endodeoxyribonuclease RusA